MSRDLFEEYGIDPLDDEEGIDLLAERPPKRISGAGRSFETDRWTDIEAGLERAHREMIPDMPPEELARAGVEGLGMVGGAAAGALVPVPGASYIGAGLGYAATKRLANWAMDEPLDTTPMGVGRDLFLGGALQGAANLIGKIPGLRKIFAPKEAAIGPETTFGADALDRAAYATMEKSMKVPPSGRIGGQAVDRERVIGTALEEGITITKGGINRTKGMLDDIIDKMDDAVAQSAAKNNPVLIDDVLGPVNDLRKWASQTVQGNKFAGQIDDVVDAFRAQYGDIITVEQAQAIKQNTGAFLKKAYGELKPIETEATKQIVRGLKDRIAAEIPEITGLNAKYGDLKQLELALERAVNRTGNWDWFSLSAGMAGAVTGGATGSMAKAVEAVGLWRLLKAPRVQSNLAIVLKRMGKGSQANVMADVITTTVYNKMTGSNMTNEIEPEYLF